MSTSPFPDLTLPPQTILMNMLNTINAQTLPRPLQASDCVFGDPAPYGGDGANTQIPFGTTQPATFGAGTVLIRYSRIDIGQVFAANQPAVATNLTLKSQLLPSLNSAYNLNMQAADIIDGPISSATEPFTVTINCAANSLIYTGTSTMTFGTAAVAPTSSPAPSPTPAAPTPAPAAPTPTPAAPTPSPAPTPAAPTPSPAPSPAPTPTAPTPSPAPSPTPTPTPSPTPAPTPTAPTPTPAPSPTPTAPTPSPTPTP